MAWQETYHHPLQVFVNNDAVLLMLPSECQVHELTALLTPENVESYLAQKLEQTGTFGAHFRENAGRALLLPKQNFRKRMPLWLNRLRSKKLLQSIQRFEDFPILLETWRTCLQDEFDLPHLKACLEEIHTREIRITAIETNKPSPFADGLVWRQTNQYMYEDDTPLASNRISLKGELLRDLLFSSHLRPQIPRALIEELEAKRQRTHQDRRLVQRRNRTRCERSGDRGRHDEIARGDDLPDMRNPGPQEDAHLRFGVKCKGCRSYAHGYE